MKQVEIGEVCITFIIVLTKIATSKLDECEKFF